MCTTSHVIIYVRCLRNRVVMLLQLYSPRQPFHIAFILFYFSNLIGGTTNLSPGILIAFYCLAICCSFIFVCLLFWLFFVLFFCSVPLCSTFCSWTTRSTLRLPYTMERESVCVYGCCDTVAVAHPRFVQNIKQTKISFSILLCHLLLSTVHTPHGIASSFTHRCCVSQPVLHLPVARHAICFYEYNRKRRAHSPSTQWFSLSLSDSLSGQKAEQPHRQRAYRTIIFAMCILVFAIDIVNGLFE